METTHLIIIPDIDDAEDMINSIPEGSQIMRLWIDPHLGNVHIDYAAPAPLDN